MAWVVFGTCYGACFRVVLGVCFEAGFGTCFLGNIRGVVWRCVLGMVSWNRAYVAVWCLVVLLEGSGAWRIRRSSVHGSMYSVHGQLYNIHCTMYSVQSTLYSVYGPLYFV